MKVPLSDSISLPTNAATQKLAFIGRTGSGKSYGVSKMVEGMLDAGIQVIVLDPVGVWYGLRLLADGKTAGYPIPVLGGLKGDIPLEPSGGALVADLVVDRGISVVLDVSQFESDADKARFATDFATRFYFRKKASPSAVHLIVEEAQEFIPQNPQKGEERMLHAFQRMWKLGRNFGIGGTLISQRPQEVSKKALNQTEALFAFQMTGPQERKAVELWMSEKGIDLEIAGDLPGLKVGQCHVWSPQWLQVSEKIHIATKKTFNSSSTPETSGVGRKQELAPIDLAELTAKMKDTIERAKAEDPKELRRLLGNSQARLALAKKALISDGFFKATEISDDIAPRIIERIKSLREITKERIEVQILSPQDHHELNQLTARICNLSDQIEKSASEACSALGAILGKVKAASIADSLGSSDRKPAGQHVQVGRKVGITLRGDGQTIISIHLPRGELACLKACAQYTSGATREQLTVLTGYKRSSRDTYLQRLGEKNLIETDGDFIRATQSGIDALGADWQLLPTGDALREHWMQRLPEGERRVFEFVVAQYPSSVERQFIDEKTGYRRSSRDTYLQRLKAKRLVEVTRDGVRASKELFG